MADQRSVSGHRCRSCSTVTYPQHALCPTCGHDVFDAVPVSGEGCVLTYTDLYALTLAYTQRYLRLAIVQLDSGLRATGHLLDSDPQVGKRIKVQIGVVREAEGVKLYGLQFVPILHPEPSSACVSGG
ncbi:hypothetical protein JW848_07035 [Candidatus Bipolaricaulota bacterium]|nr:hypothetical protein [Candidatus Bipolaricaulota bacterium]